ncbi:M16 family metallopeptidase [Williamsia muralis]|uniref:M16 family metallopeptidase n=1 Tax=Williamsia marianensis TaxID=85044 RepID=UPI001CB9A190|nr:pitrilysin family protein [Williamsia marianensis]
MTSSRPKSASTASHRAVRRSVLPGGLRVVTEHIPGVRSASVGLWVAVGSRDEKPSVAGAAHFLEHLLFKSTPTRTAASTAQQIDAIGGELNAFTGKEHTCYYAHVLDEHLATAIDIVGDVVLRGRCRAEDVEVERTVVLEEISMRDDDPEDLLADLFMTAMYGDHPIGRPVIGSAESITDMTRTQIKSFHGRRYTPDKMVLSVAGNVSHADVLAAVRSTFAGHLDGGAAPAPIRVGSKTIGGLPSLELSYRDTEQVHILLGVRAPGRGNPDRWALSVLNTALGGGLSSRLFQEIRESRGLAYSVYSSVDSFADIGAFSVYAGCSPDHLAEVVTVTGEILSQVAREGITEEELVRAKGSLIGGMVLGLEDSQSRMHRNGRGEINYGKQLSVEQTLRKIERVTVSDTSRVAGELLSRPMGAAVVGPYRSRRQLPKSLTGLIC